MSVYSCLGIPKMLTGNFPMAQVCIEFFNFLNFVYIFVAQQL